jgi:hypothetical protein
VKDVNQSARNYSQTAHQQAQQAVHRFKVHNRQYQERLRNLTPAPRGTAHPWVASGFPGDEDDQPSGRARRPGRIVWALLAVLGLAIAGATLSSNSPEGGFMPGGSSGVDGIVREGTAWNVRGGPGMAFPPIAVVHPDEAVVVTCLERGWAQLERPNAGAFVYAKGLALNGTPPPC